MQYLQSITGRNHRTSDYSTYTLYDRRLLPTSTPSRILNLANHAWNNKRARWSTRSLSICLSIYDIMSCSAIEAQSNAATTTRQLNCDTVCSLSVGLMASMESTTVRTLATRTYKDGYGPTTTDWLTDWQTDQSNAAVSAHQVQAGQLTMPWQRNAVVLYVKTYDGTSRMQRRQRTHAELRSWWPAGARFRFGTQRRTLRRVTRCMNGYEYNIWIQ